MDLGAADYLVKGLIDPDALERAIRHAIERAEGAQAIQERDERNRGMLDHLSEPRVAEDPQVSAARFRAVFESTRSGIALVELYGDLREVNSAFARLLLSHPTVDGEPLLPRPVGRDRQGSRVEGTRGPGQGGTSQIRVGPEVPGAGRAGGLGPHHHDPHPGRGRSPGPPGGVVGGGWGGGFEEGLSPRRTASPGEGSWPPRLPT